METTVFETINLSSETVISNIPPPIDITLCQTAIRQLGKGQDRIRSGVNTNIDSEERFEWICVLDGHGANHVINAMDTYIDWDTVVRQCNPIEYLKETFYKIAREKYVIQNSSGCTFSLVKIFADRIETFIVGDSKIAVLLDNEAPIITKPHNYYDKEEVERIKDRLDECAPFKDDSSFEIISEQASFCWNAKGILTK